MRNGAGCSRFSPSLAQGSQVDDLYHRVFNTLAAMFLGVFSVAATECDNIFIAHQRAGTCDITHHRRTPACGKRQVH